MSETIARKRDQIDQIDETLVQLLSDRAVCAHAIGLRKRELGLPVFDREREERILEKVRRLNRGPLSDSALIAVFRTIIAETRSFEEEAASGERTV